MKKLLTLVMSMFLLVGACFSFTACGGNTDIGAGDGKLVIGYTIYKPMNYFDEKNDFVGFDTELAIEVCEILNVDYEFKEIVWENKVMSLDSKEIDVVWNGMTITDELKDAMSITTPYLTNKQVIVCKKDDASKFSALSLKKGLNAEGLEILVETGSAGDKTVKGLGLSPIGVTAQKDTLLEIKAGTNKVAVIDKLMADVLVGEGSANPDLTYVDVDFDLEFFGIGCRKDDVVTTFAIEKAITQLQENGTFETLINKYFG